MLLMCLAVLAAAWMCWAAPAETGWADRGEPEGEPIDSPEETDGGGGGEPAGEAMEEADEDDAGGGGEPAGDTGRGGLRVTGLAEPEDFDDDDDDGEEAGDEEDEGEDTDAAAEGEPAPADAADAAAAGAGGEPDEADQWYQLWERAEQDRRRAEAERLQLLRMLQGGPAQGAGSGGSGPAAGAGAGPGPVTGGGEQPSAVPAVPSLEQLAEQLGSVATDPYVVSYHQSLQANAKLQTELAALRSQLEPMRRQYERSQLEQQIATSFQQFCSNPAAVDPKYLPWFQANYGQIRQYFGSRAATWADAANLYLLDLQRAQAPQQAYEAGVREGATARTHRVRRGAAAAVTSAGRPSGRRLAKPVPQTIEEAYAQARQELGRRR